MYTLLYIRVFQFHKGTIKTTRLAVVYITIALFQFHKGTIKTVGGLTPSERKSNFNSIKVRLKQIGVCDEIIGVPSFQFHKGTIKTTITERQEYRDRFQFHKGTIKTPGHAQRRRL